GLFERELRSSVGTAVDSKFMALVLAGLSGSAATADVLADLRTLLNAVSLKRGQPYFIAASDVAKMLATAKASSGGERLFEDTSPTGGELIGLPMLVSDGVANGTLTLLNAGQMAVAFEGIFFDTARAASLEMVDSGMTE